MLSAGNTASSCLFVGGREGDEERSRLLQSGRTFERSKFSNRKQQSLASSSSLLPLWRWELVAVGGEGLNGCVTVVEELQRPSEVGTTNGNIPTCFPKPNGNGDGGASCGRPC